VPVGERPVVAIQIASMIARNLPRSVSTVRQIWGRLQTASFQRQILISCRSASDSMSDIPGGLCHVPKAVIPKVTQMFESDGGHARPHIS